MFNVNIDLKGLNLGSFLGVVGTIGVLLSIYVWNWWAFIPSLIILIPSIFLLEDALFLSLFTFAVGTIYYIYYYFIQSGTSHTSMGYEGIFLSISAFIVVFIIFLGNEFKKN